MSTEAPFNADLATARWVNKMRSSDPITNQDLFELTRDILQIHGGEDWQHSEPLHLREEGTPRHIIISFASLEDLSSENIRVEVVQEDQPLEEIILWRERGREHFTTWWEETSQVTSLLLGYNLTDTEFLVQIDLKPEETLKLAKTIWGVHAYTLVKFGKKGIWGLPPAATEQDSISIN